MLCKTIAVWGILFEIFKLRTVPIIFDDLPVFLDSLVIGMGH